MAMVPVTNLQNKKSEIEYLVEQVHHELCVVQKNVESQEGEIKILQEAAVKAATSHITEIAKLHEAAANIATSHTTAITTLEAKIKTIEATLVDLVEQCKSAAKEAAKGIQRGDITSPIPLALPMSRQVSYLLPVSFGRP